MPADFHTSRCAKCGALSAMPHAFDVACIQGPHDWRTLVEQRDLSLEDIRRAYDLGYDRGREQGALDSTPMPSPEPRVPSAYVKLAQAAVAVIQDARDQGRDDCMDDLVDEAHIERLRNAIAALDAIAEADGAELTSAAITCVDCGKQEDADAACCRKCEAANRHAAKGNAWRNALKVAVSMCNAVAAELPGARSIGATECGNQIAALLHSSAPEAADGSGEEDLRAVATEYLAHHKTETPESEPVRERLVAALTAADGSVKP